MNTETRKVRRLSLTKAQLHEDVGSELLGLLTGIVADGKLADEEIVLLKDWLADHRTYDLPAIGFLTETVESILASGTVSDDDRLDLFLAIERVLPVTERRTSQQAREKANPPELPPPISREDLRKMKDDGSSEGESKEEEHSRWRNSGTWRVDPMTDAQRQFIRSLGGSISAGATKGEASDLIEQLLGNKPITSRQQMVMRFWNRVRGPGEGPREISEWMDAFYSEDSDRKRAWELFKCESEDNGLQGEPARVPVGVGPTYLARIKQGGDAAVPRFRTGSSAAAHPSELRRQIVVQAGPSMSAIFYSVAAVVTGLLGLGYALAPDRHATPAPASTKTPAPVQSRKATATASPSVVEAKASESAATSSVWPQAASELITTNSENE